MPLYLDEDQAGQDPALIGFPHLLLCQGVVCLLGDGSLVGGHLQAEREDGYTAGPNIPGTLRPSTATAQLAAGATKMHKAGHILTLTHYTV